MSADHALLNALLGATAAGDQAAFAELYRLTSPRLYASACRLLRADAEAREALQDAFVRVWERAASFDPARGQALHWMGGIVRYACLDRLRNRKQILATEDSLALLEDEAAPVAQDAAIDIARCMGALSGPERGIIVLAVQTGLSHSEVSASLGMPIGTVKSHVRRGLLKLRLCLETAAGHV
jgi:RNA polymerase sigma-70 factor (ECF subfamily)